MQKERWEERKFTVEKITAILGFAYATVAIFQWNEMRKPTKATQRIIAETGEHFRADERAWIEIEPIKADIVVVHTPKSGALFKYNIYPKNLGKTASHNITFKAQSTGSSISLGTNAEWMKNLQDKMLLNQFKESGTDKPVIVPSNPVPKILAPGAIAPAPFVLTGQEPQIVPKDELVSYLIGGVDYLDQFQVAHRMKFCFFVANRAGELWSCKEENEEDQNPKINP
jgi:hypothetical protein